MPRTERLFLRAQRLQALPPAACLKHGGEPRHDACPACLADALEAVIGQLPADSRAAFCAEAARLRAEHLTYRHPVTCARCKAHIRK